MSKSFSFKEQLEVGDRGEQLFLEHYPHKIKIFPGREYDFETISSKKKIELKTDTYNIDKTDNFFFERFSDIHRQTPGGPWRAKKDKVDIFCYYFVRHNIWFQFNDIPKLVDRLNKLTNNKKSGMVYIKNRGWVTGGFKVPRNQLDDLFEVWEF